jgi:glycosyltransferase involved in cell wall biosynthesis
MSRFPKLTETFILYEVLALEAQGTRVEIYPLLREKTEFMHRDAEALVRRAHYCPFISPEIFGVNLRRLFRQPDAYLGTLFDLLRANWGSTNYFIGALGIFPKSVLFAEQMERSGIQHVHAHFASHPAAAAFVIHRLTGIPFSFTAHGSDLHVDRHMLREKVAEAAFVVAVSNYNRNLIIEECDGRNAEKVYVIHCGVDTAVFRPRSKEPLESGQALRILCIGTLHEVKGQQYLIEACRLLKERGIPTECRFIGAGPDQTMLESLIAQAGMNDSIFLLGRRTRDEVAAELAETDVVVAPSVPTPEGRREGIPVALMEAMACGVPVVASGISGIPELVEHERTGLLTEPRKPESLAAALARLCGTSTLRAQLGAAGREKVLREFDLFANACELNRRISAGTRDEESGRE